MKISPVSSFFRLFTVGTLVSVLCAVTLTLPAVVSAEVMQASNESHSGHWNA